LLNVPREGIHPRPKGISDVSTWAKGGELAVRAARGETKMMLTSLATTTKRERFLIIYFFGKKARRAEKRGNTWTHLDNPSARKGIGA